MLTHLARIPYINCQNYCSVLFKNPLHLCKPTFRIFLMHFIHIGPPFRHRYENQYLSIHHFIQQDSQDE